MTKSKINNVIKIIKIFLLLLTICGMIVVVNQNVYAEMPEVTGLVQTGAYTTSINVEWNAISGDNIRYKVWISKDKENGYQSGSNYDTSRTSILISNSSSEFTLNAGKTYYVKIEAYEKTYVNGTYTDTTVAISQPCQVVTCPSSKVSKLVQTGAKETEIDLQWKAATDANYYFVEYYKLGDYKNTITKKVSKTSIKLTGLSKDSKYYVYVKAARKSSSGYIAKSSDSVYDSFVTLPTKVTGVKYLSTEDLKKWRFQWKQKTYADGYQYSLYNEKGKALKSGTGTISTGSLYYTIKNKNLKANKFFGIKIRGYINTSNGKKYGAYSKMIYFSTNEMKDTKNEKVLSAGKLKAKWKKVTGATSYDVYASTKLPSSISDMTKIKTLSASKLSYVITKVKGKKVSTKNTYYVAIRANMKVGKTTYHSVPYIYRTMISLK